jgi:hypothetical protein
MPRVDTTFDIVLTAIAERLRTQLGINARQGYESVNPESPVFPPGGNTCIIVTPGDGTFDAEMQIGGGAAQLSHRASVMVTYYTNQKLDSTHHSEKTLHDSKRGLMRWMRKILRVLVGHDLVDPDGNTFLRQTLYATHSYRPYVDANTGMARISLEFGVDFDWDLTDDDDEE